MPTQRITFPTASGAQLSARLDLPAGAHLATAIFAHCFTCGKDIPAARRIAARLAGMGIAVLRFDFTGLGHSEGEFANTSFTSNVDDLVAAADHLTLTGLAPTMLIGHSLGGAAVLKAATKIKGLKAVVTLGAPFDPGHVTHNFADAIPAIMENGAAEVSLGGRPFTIGKEFIEDVAKTELKACVANLNTALLVMHAPLDSIVSVDNAAEIFMAAKHPKSTVTLDDADHTIRGSRNTLPKSSQHGPHVTLNYAHPPPPIGAPEGNVRTCEADAKGFLQDIHAGPVHYALADEPFTYGGTNKGISPYGFLSAGLGACTSMTIRMYARRKGWPLNHVSVDVNHSKVHAQDAVTESTDKIDTWNRKITLTRSLSGEQRQRLLEIADRCPVHRTLERSSEVVTELEP